ncbi:hypothetical protein BROUX41_001869 [Berkeleyomyces rouxiae]|uniref:uncharacterized protein n=1 Tax=Berkeleyomyces rouxiae TaxID=2035830 RepID=UPI003B78767F
MKFPAAVLLAAAGVATAQFDGVPQCGIQCLTAAIERIGCDINNPACSCTAENQTRLASDLQMVTCLTTSCSADELADTISAGTKLCSVATASLASSSTPLETASLSRLGFAAASGVASSTTAPLASSTASQHDADISAADFPTFSSIALVAAILIGTIHVF